MTDSILSTFTAVDGDNLAVHDWYLSSRDGVRATIILVHDLGDYALRHDHVAQRLHEWGFSVRGYDQHGHGRSAGVRGSLPAPSRWLDDLADMIDSVRARRGRGMPVVLLGFGAGAVLAARFAFRALRPIDALVMVSPAFELRLGWLRRLWIDVMPGFALDWTLSSGLRPSHLSHERAIVEAYRVDPLVHNRISGRLARFILDSGMALAARARKWPVPTLLLYAGADGIVNPAATRRFAAEASPGAVTSVCFDTLYHEIFNEPERQGPYARLREWLQGRFPPLRMPPPRG